MKLKILLDGDPGLRGVSAPVKEITKELKKLALDMCETMIHSGGIGLAAPQVGRKIQLIVFDTTFSEDNGSTAIMFNPEIMHGEGVVSSVEGCLSLPGRQIPVERYKSIKVKYKNIYGEALIKTFDGLAAVVIQHELDHLQGIILSDYEEQ
jgi:peptide deformylase